MQAKCDDLPPLSPHADGPQGPRDNRGVPGLEAAPERRLWVAESPSKGKLLGKGGDDMKVGRYYVIL